MARMTLAISRSRLRTPASRVYCSMTVVSASSSNSDLLVGQPVLGDLLRHQVALGDLQLLLAGVAGDLEHLHAVQQRRRDGIQHVRRGDEDDVREIEVDLEVVVGEGVVLLRVQHLEQRRRRDRPGSRAPSLSISSSMKTGFFGPTRRMPWMIRPGSAPMYVRRWPRISASSRTPPSDTRMNSRPSDAGDGLAQRGLADAGRPDEAEDRALLARRQLAHGQVLEDALLHLLQVVVVGVQDLARRSRSSASSVCLVQGSSTSHSR